MPAGRPSSYSQEKADAICQRIACGESLAEICRSSKMPNYSTVMRWLNAHEEFSKNYTRAREAQGDADADSVGDIANLVLKGKVDPQAARVAIDALKWTAAKRAPKKYGEKLDLTHGGRVAVQFDRDDEAL